MAHTLPPIELIHVAQEDALPAWITLETLAHFFHTTMQPYNDGPDEIRAGLDYALSQEPGRGGFILLATMDHALAGALVILNTGMQGYVPEHLLLYITVAPQLRGQGIGQRLIEEAMRACPGEAIKLHVDPDNPARRLYERMGFKVSYLDMRYHKAHQE